MIESYIKYYILLNLSLFLFGKLINKKISHKKILVNTIIFVLSNTVLYAIRIYLPYFTILILLILTIIHAIITYQVQAKLAIATSIISLGLCYILFSIASICAGFLLSFTYYCPAVHSYIKLLHIIVTFIIMILFAIIIFKFKRFKNGMPFLLSKQSNTIGIFTTCCILLFSSLFTLQNLSNSIYSLIIIIAIVLGIILLIWWWKQLNILYVNRFCENKINQLESDLDNSRKDNEHLGNIIHKDNKLIPAMVMSVHTAISSINNCDTKTAAKLTDLLSELEKLSAERSSLVTKQIDGDKIMPTSGLFRLDMMLQFMKQKADNLSIELSYDFHINIHEMLTTLFTEDFITTIIADLTENALIATNLSCNFKKIYIDFTLKNNIYRIDIYDTGIPFEPYTIQNAGKKRGSTHLDTGGSGIGLITIFTLLKQCGGSFEIDEILDNTDYTKKVSIVLDSLNQYRIHSNRANILDVVRHNPNIVMIE